MIYDLSTQEGRNDYADSVKKKDMNTDTLMGKQKKILNNLKHQMDGLKLYIQKDILDARYRTLSELWEPKSKHKIHQKISKMIDAVLVEIENVNKEIIKENNEG
jgi:hypothetical protein